MKHKEDNKPLKYNLSMYVTKPIRDMILRELCISKSTYYRNAKAKIDENHGFEACQLLIISSILERPISDLITPEASEYCIKKKTQKSLSHESTNC